MAEEYQPSPAALEVATTHGLDASSSKKILLYQHYVGLSLVPQAQLCKKLSEEPSYTLSTHALPRTAGSIELTALDLVPAAVRAEHEGDPHLNVSVAFARFPWRVRLPNLLSAKYDVLWILSGTKSGRDGAADAAKDAADIMVEGRPVGLVITEKELKEEEEKGLSVSKA